MLFIILFFVCFISCSVSEKQQKTDVPDSIEFVKNNLVINDNNIETEQAVTLKLSPCLNCNQTDAQGRKQGLWREVEKYEYTEFYYKDGLKHGVYRVYRLKYPHTLTELGEFKEGEWTGNLYSFGVAGEKKGERVFSELAYILRNIEKVNTIVKCPNREIGFRFRAYMENYHRFGVLKSEGIILFDESFHTDDFRYSTWKFYNEEGKLIKTEESPDYKGWCSVDIEN
jgi:hypothetical protein